MTAILKLIFIAAFIFTVGAASSFSEGNCNVVSFLTAELFSLTAMFFSYKILKIKEDY
jgi:hypothetical protein